MKKVQLLNTFPVFSSLSDECCLKLQNDGAVHTMKLEPHQQVKSGMVYCVLKGTCIVYSKNGSKQGFLRYLKKGDIFGVAAIYANDEELSIIETETAVTLYALSPQTIDHLVKTEPAFLDAYLSYLSNRIAFLNSKISCVTAGSAEQKLARWIDSYSTEDEFLLPISNSDLAKLLDLGRASLYRAFDVLEEAGCIEKDGNTIHIKERTELKARF